MVRFSAFALALAGCGTLVHAQGYGYGPPGPAVTTSAHKSSSVPKPSATPHPAGSGTGPTPSPPAGPSNNAATGTATGDVQCTDAMCIGATVNGNNIDYVMQSTGSQKLGWMAMGFGSHMVGSPMVIMWPNPDGSITISQRQAKSESLPAVVANPPRAATVSKDLSAASGQQPKLAYTIPADTNMQPELIWAFGTDTPSSSNGATATFQQHLSMGTISLDLTKSNNASILASPVLSLEQPSGSNGGSTPTAPKSKSSGPAPAEKVILAHAIVCSVAFLVVMPAGALLARYLRTFSNTWFKGHWILQFGISAPIVLVGAILAGSISHAGGPDISNTHTRVGVVLFIVYTLQCILGSIIHFVKPKNAKGRPPQNYIHAVFGLTIIGLGFYQVRTGYAHEWPRATGRPAPMAINALWYVWVVTIPLAYFGGLALLRRQFAQEKEARALPKLSPWQEAKGYHV